MTGNSFSNKGGTPGYRPYELLIGTNNVLTTAVDIWAAGVILLQFLTGINSFFSLDRDNQDDIFNFNRADKIEAILPIIIFYGKT